MPSPARLLALAAALALLASRSPAEAQRGRRRAPLRIAVLADGPAPTYVDVATRLAAEMQPLLRADHPDVVVPSVPTAVGDWTQARADALVRDALADREVDLIVGLGVQVGRAVGRVERLSKPVLLPFAAPALQGLPRDGATSGRRNLAYLTGLIDLQRELRRFNEVVRAERVPLVVDRHITDNVTGLPEAIAAATEGLDLQITLVPVDPDPDAIVAALPEDAQAVYLGPLPRLDVERAPALLEALNARELPTYASEGRRWVELGALTTLVPDDDLVRRLRRVALQAQEALAGEDPGTFPTAFAPHAELVINMATARRIGAWPRFELLTEAELLNDQRGRRGPELTFRSALREAVERNLDLGARRVDQTVADARVDQARGALIPTLDGNAGFQWTDPDVASPIGNSERQLSWGLTGQVVAYSPRALAGLRAAEHSADATEASIRTAEIDVIRQAAEAYLNVLRARTAERINRENLGRVRRNLALAEVRREIGAAGREEVYRWEIEIADGRVKVIDAIAVRNQAEIALNRILAHELEAPFTIAEPSHADTGVVLDERVGRYLEDPWSFDVFRAFLAREAVANAPELQEIDAALRAQRRTLVGQRRQLFLPDVVVQGGFTHVFFRGGAGSDPIDASGLPAGFEGLTNSFPEQDDFTWNVGAGLQWRLFDAGRYAEIDQAEASITQLETQRAAVELAVRQRVRSALHAAGASSAAIRLRRDAARAAQANFELVTDAYRRGAVGLVRLIDAQNQALLTDLAASNAVYDFLLDYVAVERAVGAFTFTLPPEELDAFVRRLNRFATERRAEEREQAAEPIDEGAARPEEGA